jgi:hypothetical protein
MRTPLPGLFLTRALLGALLKLAVVRSQRTKSFQNPKVLNASEDAHLKIMSTFETDEHLQGKSVLTSVFEGDGSLDDED